MSGHLTGKVVGEPEDLYRNAGPEIPVVAGAQSWGVEGVCHEIDAVRRSHSVWENDH